MSVTTSSDIVKNGPDPIETFGLLIKKGFFDAPTCRQIVAEMRSGQGESATVYGRDPSGSVDERVRKAIRYTLSHETVEAVKQRLWACQKEFEDFFRVRLSSCEGPHFLRYRVGDFFVAHQDGNTGMLRLDQEARRVSVTIFLNRHSDALEDDTYRGGSLVFHDWRSGQTNKEFRLEGELGSLVAFRSETTHEVTPVVFGERYSIACWFR
jgi:SM-20-related protein